MLRAQEPLNGSFTSYYTSLSSEDCNKRSLGGTRIVIQARFNDLFSSNYLFEDLQKMGLNCK